jgi:hypothetical protein
MPNGCHLRLQQQMERSVVSRCLYVYIHVFVYVSMYVFVYVSLCVCIYIYTHTQTCIHIHLRKHSHTHACQEGEHTATLKTWCIFPEKQEKVLRIVIICILPCPHISFDIFLWLAGENPDIYVEWGHVHTGHVCVLHTWGHVCLSTPKKLTLLKLKPPPLPLPP